MKRDKNTNIEKTAVKQFFLVNLTLQPRYSDK